jgi:hypothetical protein
MFLMKSANKRQGDGRLSERARTKEFETLSAEEVARIEEIFASVSARP